MKKTFKLTLIYFTTTLINFSCGKVAGHLAPIVLFIQPSATNLAFDSFPDVLKIYDTNKTKNPAIHELVEFFDLNGNNLQYYFPQGSYNAAKGILFEYANEGSYSNAPNIQNFIIKTNFKTKIYYDTVSINRKSVVFIDKKFYSIVVRYD